MGNIIIDRRKNPGGKNTPNRQRFLKKVKGQIQSDIKRNITSRDILDHTSGDKVKIKRKTIHEPEFRNDPTTGDRDFILPGNKDFVTGDSIKKDTKGAGGKGSKASDSGEGEDDFYFDISRDEYMDILFEDLELPNIKKVDVKHVEFFERQRSGYNPVGNPSQLNLVQSMRNSIGRRIALKKPKDKKIKELEEQLSQETDETKKNFLLDQIQKLKKRLSRIPFIDPKDLRYNNYSKVPKPHSQAVMFFIMDVSASMTKEHKDLAKRFFILLNLFLSKRYKRSEVVFIRHHHEADECSEDEFFNSRLTGGTRVSSAYDLVYSIMQNRYPSDRWNIYVSQATDGDNFELDNDNRLLELLNKILKNSQLFTYIDVDLKEQLFDSLDMIGVEDKHLTRTMRRTSKTNPNLVVKKIDSPSNIYRVFREIFGEKHNG